MLQYKKVIQKHEASFVDLTTKIKDLCKIGILVHIGGAGDAGV